MSDFSVAVKLLQKQAAGDFKLRPAVLSLSAALSLIKRFNVYFLKSILYFNLSSNKNKGFLLFSERACLRNSVNSFWTIKY